MRFGSLTCLLSISLVFACGDTEPTSEGTAQKTCVTPDCCFSNDDCADGEYCGGEGACDSEGSCKLHEATPCPIGVDPETRIPHAPVCGCDGITYRGRCQANNSGIRIAHDGLCEAGTCFSDDDCNEGEYCEGDGDGACDSLGRCKVISSHPCGLAFDTETGELTQPVCGCDGVTYQGACMASGHRIAHDGVCGAATCFSNDDCAEGLVCRGEGGCDSIGACKLVSVRPCELPRVSEPVCGCDGVAYQSACHAINSGQRIDHDGLCE